jgi:hypothetical protein
VEVDVKQVAVGLSLSVLALSACTEGGSLTANTAPSTEQAIINGATCGEDVEPTAVAVIIDATISGFDIMSPICTGTLIAPDVVLLAAHCVDATLLTGGFGEVERADYYISFQADLSEYTSDGTGRAPPVPESAIPADAHVSHPEFDLEGLSPNGTTGVEHDIALLFLEVPIETVQPEIVITTAEAEQLAVGDAVTIAGWGQTNAADQSSVAVKNCGASTIDELGEALVQIGAAASATRKCHGDSGGPTYIEIDTAGSIKRRVIGVTSRAYDESDCAKGGVDTRVDAYLDYLDGEMTAACTAGTRAWCDVPGIIPASFYEDGGAGNEGEGEGEAAEGEGEDEDDEDPVPGCAAAPVDSVFGLSVLVLALRRRRR